MSYMPYCFKQYNNNLHCISFHHTKVMQVAENSFSKDFPFIIETREKKSLSVVPCEKNGSER